MLDYRARRAHQGRLPSPRNLAGGGSAVDGGSSNSIESHPRQDVEKSAALVMQTNNSVEDNSALPSYPWLNRFIAAGVEVRGVQPVPPEERTARGTGAMCRNGPPPGIDLIPIG